MSLFDLNVHQVGLKVSWKLMLLIGLLCVLQLACSAQDSITTYRPFSITYSTQDGLPSNQIIYLYNDSKGLMWIGTERGLASFDGRDFKLYDNKELSQSFINCISEDKRGRIWAVTLEGNFFIVDKDKVTPHPQNKAIVASLKRDKISNFLVDTNNCLNYSARGTFWKATFDSVYSFHKKNNSFTYLEKRGHGLFVDFENRGTDNHQLRFKIPDSVFTYIKTFDLGVCFPYSAATDSSFAVAFSHNVIVYDKRKIYHVKLPSSATNSLAYSKTGSVWIGTEGKGAFEIKNGRIISNYFPNEKIHSIREDFEGGMWFGMPSSGVRYSPNKAIAIHRDNVASKQIKHLFSDHHSRLCFITQEGLLFKNGKKIGTCIPQNKKAQFVESTLSTNDKFCFSYKTTSSEAELVCIDRSTYNISNRALNSANPEKLAIEPNGDTIGTEYSLFFNSKKHFYLRDASKRLFFRDLKRHGNSLWAASNFGIYKLIYHKHDSTMFSTDNVIADSIYWRNILSIAGELFGITKSGDLFQINEYDSTTVPVDLCALGRELITSRIYQNKGYLAFTDGIVELSVSHSLYDSTQVNLHYLPINTKLFGSAIYDIEVINDSLFIASSDGITSANIAQLNSFFYLSKLSVDQLTYKDQRITDLSKPLNFYFGENLSFTITAPHFQTSRDYNYLYRLLPDDTAWHKSKQSELNFFKLPPDTYQLQVLLDSQTQKSVVFSIQNRWYQQIWFIILVAIFFTTLCFLPFYYRTRLHRVTDKIEREKNNLRFSTLNIQLKPHFIFNALNSIQSYMLEQDTVKATSYLSKFAQHIRSTLEQSREDLIPLSDSLESLENYLVLEQMRKNNALNFQITVDATIHKQNVKIPPLLIQPYVENAIIHGFADVDEGGVINILVKKLNDDQILIKVSDNGQGLSNALSSTPTINSKKKSLATLINSERIETLNALYDNQFSVEINCTENLKGVTVDIIIPIEL